MTGPVRMVWLVVGGLVTVAVMLFAGRTFADGALPGQKDEGRRVFLQQVTRIELDSNAGDAVLRAGADGEVDLKRSTSWSSGARPETSEIVEGTTLRLRVRCPEGHDSDDCSVDYDLTVPAGVVLDLRTEEGDLDLGGLSGAAKLSTTAGDVRVSDASGDVYARTQSGSIRAEGLRSGTVDADAQTGDSELTFVAPPRSVRAVTQAGDVTVTVPPGAYAVQASAESQEARVGFTPDESAPNRITARAGAGSVDVRFGN